MGAIGVPSEYEAWIVDSLTQRTLIRLPWAQISWERLRNGLSQASVTVPPEQGGPNVCAVTGGLAAWKQMLVIERDGKRVWDGPVTGWSAGSSLTVNAKDRSAMLDKRIVATSFTTGWPQDLYVDLVSRLLTDAGFYTTTGTGPMPYLVTPKPYFDPNGPAGSGFSATQFNITIGLASYEIESLTTLASLFASFGEGAQFSWTQQNEVLHMYSMWIDPASGTSVVYPATNPWKRAALNTGNIITETGELSVVVNAENLVTGVYKGTTGLGIRGFVNPTYGGSLNTGYITAGIYGTITDSEGGVAYQSDAFGNNVFPAQFPPPYPDVTIEDIQLAPNFSMPMSEPGFDDIIPGIIVDLDFPESCMLNIPVQTYDARENQFLPRQDPTTQHARLEHLNVNVTFDGNALSEVVTASLSAISLGYQEL